MPNLTSQLTVRLIDAVSGPARGAAAAIRGIGSAVRGTNSASAAIGSAMREQAAAMAMFRMRVMDAVAAVYVLRRALGAPISAALDFETLLEDIGQKGDISGDGLMRLGERIREVARATNQTTMEMGKAIDAVVGFGASSDQAIALAPAIGKVATAYRAASEDIARAGFSVISNLKVPAEQAMRAFDAMALSGKEGAFELRDMARYFPSLTAMGKALGMEGVEGVADLAAALQIVRKGAGTSEEAAVNLINVMQKALTPKTRKKFAGFGINIRKEMDKGLAAGMSPIETLAIQTERALKKGAVISDLFEDRQAQLGMIALLQNMEEYRRIRALALKASGMVEADFARRMKTAQASMNAFKAAVENLKIAVGNNVMPTLTAMVQEFTAALNSMDERVSVFDRIGAALKGLMQGLGFEGVKDLQSGLKAIFDLVLGRTQTFEQDTDELGRIFLKFREMGASVREFVSSIRDAVQPITDFLGIDWGTFLSYGAKFAAAAIGITMLAKAVRGLFRAFLLLSGLKLGWTTTKAIREIAKIGLGMGAGAAAGAAGAATGAAGAAAGGAAAGAAKAGWLRNLLRFGGIAALGLAIKEALGAIDPKGNLWGLTEPLDEWFRRNLGFDPSNVGGSGDAKAPAQDGAQLPDDPLFRRQADMGASAGEELMDGYEDAIRRGFADIHAMVDVEVRKLKAKLSTSAGITITPRVEGATLRGVHADTGVE